MHELTHQQSKQLFEINRLITQSLDVKEVLRKLVNAAKDLVIRGDTIIIYELRDDGLLHFADGVGINQTLIKQVKFSSGESIVGKVLKEKRTFNITGEEAEVTMDTMTPDNRRLFTEAIFHKKIQSVISTPLLYEGKCIGVLVVDNFKDIGGKFSSQETEVIEILANQAAIALFNCQFYEMLQQRNKALIEAQEIHNKFTDILLEGRGIDQIVQVLSRILKKEVTYTEKQMDIGYSYPIVSSGETLGYFQLKHAFEKSEKLEQIAIEKAAMATILELTKQNNLFERESYMKEEEFEQLIKGGKTKRASDNSIQLKLAKYKNVTCAVMAGRGGALWQTDSLISKQRFIRNMENYMQRLDPDIIVFSKGTEVIFLFSQLTQSTYNRFLEIIEEEAEANSEAVIGFGRSVSLGMMAETYQEAKEALEIVRDSPVKKYSKYEELGFERLWHKQDRETLSKYVNDYLRPLLREDLIDFHTLKAFIDMNGQHNKTAEQLKIHPNTLNYRLKKIENQLAVDLKKHRDYLAVMTALDIMEYLKTSFVVADNKR